MDKETAIKAISEKLLLLKDINNYKKFMNWQTTVVGTLSNIYTASDKRVESFQRISSYAVYFDTTIDKTNDAKESAEELLNSLIKDLENFGIVKFSSDSSKTGVNINVNQNNHQITFRVIGSNGIRYFFQQHCLTNFWLCHNQPPLTLTQWSKKVHHPGGVIILFGE